MNKDKVNWNNNNKTLFISLVILLLFAFFLSKIFLKGQAFLQISNFFPSWQQQQWLEYPGGSEVLYVRKSFNLNSPAEWAFVSVSAKDEFIVYLNGHIIGKKTLYAEQPVEVYSATPFLQLGRNTLAVRSVSQQRYISAQTIAKLHLRTLGKITTLSSDKSWRVENKELFQKQGLLKWFENDYVDNAWLLATTKLNNLDKQTSPLTISSDELQKLQPTNWIWLNYLNLRRLKISKTFKLDTDTINNAWLSISTEGSYQLTINDLVFPTKSKQQEKMDYFSIAAYLQKGKNEISIQFQSASNRLDKVAISGFITTRNSLINFSVAPEWNCGKKLCQYVSIVPGQYLPILKATILTAPLKYTLRQGYKQFKWFMLILLSCLLPAIWLIPLLTTHKKFSFAEACLAFSQPFALASCLLSAIIIINADSRFNLAHYYPVVVPLWIVIMITLLLWRLGTECKRTNNTFIKET